MESKWYKDLTKNQLDDLKRDPKSQESLKWFKRPAYQYTSMEGGEHGRSNSNTDSAVYCNNRTTGAESL
jgi:hypothetical protein